MLRVKRPFGIFLKNKVQHSFNEVKGLKILIYIRSEAAYYQL